MPKTVGDAIRGFEPALPLAVALSGGADSTALLVACAEKWPGQVFAFHINHGLQTAASVFERQCHSLCQSLHVPLFVRAVDASHASGQSPEDAARLARYEAIGALAGMEYGQAAIKSIAIAQHADDQVETVLLALTRGAGLAGLSGMPVHWQRDGRDFYRPLLEVSGAEIRHWLAQRGISFIEDPTNVDQSYTRNRIRARLLPELHAAFPQFRETFARSARHAGQAQGLLDEFAAQDLGAAIRSEDGLPQIKFLQTLTLARLANVLRYWLKKNFGVVPSTAQMAELASQIAACTTRGHRIHIKVGRGFVKRVGPVLTWYNP